MPDDASNVSGVLKVCLLFNEVLRVRVGEKLILEAAQSEAAFRVLPDAFPFGSVAEGFVGSPIPLPFVARAMGNGQVVPLIAIHAALWNDVFNLGFFEDDFLKAEWTKTERASRLGFLEQPVSFDG